MDVEAARMGETINVSALNTRHLLDTYLMDDSPHELNLSVDLKAHLISLFSFSGSDPSSSNGSSGIYIYVYIYLYIYIYIYVHLYL
jgi:hypothetical protein